MFDKSKLASILEDEGLIKTAAATTPFGGVGLWVVAKRELSDLDGKPLERGSIWKIMRIEPRKTLLARIPNRGKDVEDKRDTRVFKKLLKKNFVQGYKPIKGPIRTMEEAGWSAVDLTKKTAALSEREMIGYFEEVASYHGSAIMEIAGEITAEDLVQFGLENPPRRQEKMADELIKMWKSDKRAVLKAAKKAARYY